jgi:DNA replication protein DnaD
MELIHYAYEKCLENTEKLSFEYINKVVTSWHMEGLKTIEEVDEYNKKYKNSNKNNSSSSSKLDLEKYKIFINQFE